MTEQNNIPALSKSIVVLKAIAGGMQNYSIAEIAREIDVAHTTCYRIIQTLIDADWLQPRSGGVGYELSYGFLPMVQPFLCQRVLIDTISPIIEKLVQEVGLTAKLTVSQGDEAVTIYRVESPLPMSLSGRIGVRFNLGYGSSGACILSRMSQQRVKRIIDEAPKEVWRHQTPDDVLKRIDTVNQQGFCVDLGHFHPQIHTLSAPLRDANDHIPGVLTLIGLPDDMKQKELASHSQKLCKAIQRCNQLIRRDELIMDMT